MFSFAKQYFLGRDREADDYRLVGSNDVGLEKGKQWDYQQNKEGNEIPGVVERERRRRSGTGPPALRPSSQLPAGQFLSVSEPSDRR